MSSCRMKTLSELIQLRPDDLELKFALAESQLLTVVPGSSTGRLPERSDPAPIKIYWTLTRPWRTPAPICYIEAPSMMIGRVS